jgi:hypothetical protein
LNGRNRLAGEQVRRKLQGSLKQLIARALDVSDLFRRPKGGVAAETIQRLQCRESQSTALTIGAPAEMDIGPIGTVLVPAAPAAQDVDVLVVVCAGEVSSLDNDLPISIPVTRLGRPFAHGG